MCKVLYQPTIMVIILNKAIIDFQIFLLFLCYKLFFISFHVGTALDLHIINFLHFFYCNFVTTYNKQFVGHTLKKNFVSEINVTLQHGIFLFVHKTTYK
jgi:hypothetical protein